MAGTTITRGMVSLALVAVTAGAAAVQAGDVSVALIAAVGGAAAVLYALTMRPPDPPRPAAGQASDPTPAIAQALDTLPEPLLIVAGDRVVHANPQARALLGEHVVGEDVRVAIRHPAAAELLGRADGGVGAEAVEIAGVGARDQHWAVSVAALSSASGDATGRRLVHFADRSGSRATERIRVDFVANASHELRTPLASLLGFIETLGDEAGEDRATRNRFLKLMFDEARRMQRLVDDLISLSRIEAGKFRAPDTLVDLAALVEEVRQELAAGHGPRGADIVLALQPLPPVAADRVQMSQMLHNVIGNALKYGRAGTPVRIDLTPSGKAMVALVVRDEGEGIAPEHLPRLTERFYRVDPGRSRSMGGTGLGLAIVKHIVERHRGQLDITSTPGVGTTVTVRLPAAAAQPGETEDD